MTTKSKTPKKRKNPPDATHRNVRAARAHTDKKLAAAFKKANRQMAALAKKLVRHDLRLDKLDRRSGVAELHGNHITALNNRLAVVEEFARGEIARLADRVYALEKSESDGLIVRVSPEALRFTQAGSPDELARALTAALVKRSACVTPKTPAATTPAEPQDFTPPHSKAARRKAVRS